MRVMTLIRSGIYDDVETSGSQQVYIRTVVECIVDCCCFLNSFEIERKNEFQQILDSSGGLYAFTIK